MCRHMVWHVLLYLLGTLGQNLMSRKPGLCGKCKCHGGRSKRGETNLRYHLLIKQVHIK